MDPNRAECQPAKMLGYASRAQRVIGLALGAWLTAAIPTQAQEPTTERPPEDRWTFTVAPYLWATSLDGKTSVGGVEADVDLPFGDILDELAIGGMLLVDVQRGRFGIAINGVFARLQPEGELGQVSLDVTSDTAWIGVAPYYRAVEWTYRVSPSGQPMRLVVEPMAGIRYTNLRVEIDGTAPGGVGRQVDQNESWVDPIVGSRLTLDLADRWTIAGEADIGGFGVGSDLAWNVQAFLGYRTSLLGRPLILTAGYRALSQDYENGNFTWDVTTQGPILGVAMRF
jgi:hypothetical protein